MSPVLLEGDTSRTVSFNSPLQESHILSSSFRPLHSGMGQAVAERTVLRKKPDGSLEDWGDVADRVALGNVSLVSPERWGRVDERENLRDHVAQARILMSGRHLQHGDETQPSRNMEVFTNCATSATSFALFLLLLNGSGVGRDYSDDMILVDYDHAPQLRCVLADTHPDFVWGRHETVRDARHKYGRGRNVVWHEVEDSREGWAKAVEIYEVMAFQKVHSNKILILDFSKVRGRGSPIGGMQGRPSSGPVPLIDALMQVASIKGSGLDPWRQAMYVDHYLAECVLVGGARRAARMSVKSWRDRTAVDFIEVKRPVEYDGLSADEVTAIRAEWEREYRSGTRVTSSPTAFLWTSNNSLGVDEEFWSLVRTPRDEVPDGKLRLWKHAQKVFEKVVECSYGDGTGEPGLINQDKLVRNDEGWDYEDVAFVGSKKFKVERDTRVYLSLLAQSAKSSRYNMITNPCGEIALTNLGGYCVIADVVPYHADSLEQAEDAFRAATRALIRVNTMDSLYKREVDRTNRIGVGMTGVHEFAWKFFRVGFRDLVRPDFETYWRVIGDGMDPVDDQCGQVRAAAFWMTLARFSRAVKEEAAEYSARLGRVAPHTDTTTKPAGTTSKLFGLSEGWHLPAYGEYMRWVQFKEDDPLVAVYEEKGYSVRRDLKSYRGMVIVGFPTVPVVAQLDMGDELVLAGEATPEEQYAWLQLGEDYYVRGVDEKGRLLETDTGNQISYTLKYRPEATSREEFRRTLLENQSKIRACSVMPQEDTSAYEYLPEEPLTKAQYESFVRAIQENVREDVGLEHVDCSTGACPIDFNKSASAA